MSAPVQFNEPTHHLRKEKRRSDPDCHADEPQAAAVVAEPQAQPPEPAGHGDEPSSHYFSPYDSSADRAERLAVALKALPQVGTDFLGFHLVAELGRGGSGKVYLATQGDLANRLVALKVSADVHLESQTLAQLQHTNVVPVFSTHRYGPLHAVCMPYFGPTTLADVLRDLAFRDSAPASGKDLLSTLFSRFSAERSTQRTADPPASLPPPGSRIYPSPDAESAPAVESAPAPAAEPRATGILQMLETLGYVDAGLWIAARTAEGLAHAHERGILHLDLKPANILLTDEGQPMLLDFNMALDTKHRPGARAEQVGGTLPYMAPEHLEAFAGRPSTVDARSDVFSLGVILFELLTRCRPYKSSNDVDDLDTMVTERRAGPPGLRRWNPAISPAVEAIVRRSLEPDPAKRYQSARDFQEDLQRQLQDLPLKHAAEPSLADRGRKWLRRHPRLTSWTTAAVVTAVALAATASWVVARGQRLAGLEAAAALARFDDDAKSAHFLLTARTTDRDQLDRGIAQGRELLGRYQVLQDPNWQQRSAVRHLAAGDRERLRQDAGALLLLVARAEALDSPDRDRLGDALALNRRAEDCFPAGAGPRVLWQQRGQLLEQLGDAAGAGAARATAEATPLSTARDHYLLGAEHATRGRYREALPHLEEATRRDPQSFWAAFLQGLCHDGLTQDAEALASFRACAALRPDFPWTYFNRGLVYLRQKDYRHARAEFDRAIDLEPDAAEAYVNRALALQGLGQHREAVADLTHALDLGVPQTRVYFMRALARERLGDKEGAKRDREIGLRERPTDDRSWLARGLARLPDLEAALADFREAYKLNPRSQAALQNMAHALGRLGRTEEAVKSLDTALDLYPDYAPARSGRGVLLARLGKRDAALSDAREALRRDTRAPTLYQAAGIYALTSKQVADDRREAFRLLAAALRQGFGFDLLAIDRDLDPIRDDPEFRELVAAARALTGLPRKAESQGGTKD